MKLRIKYILNFCLVLLPFSLLSQSATILNATLNEYNVSINGLSQITLSSEIDGKIRIESNITNVSNTLLLKLVSTEFYIKKGVTTLNASTLKFAQISYSNHSQANYIKTFNQLPSGVFNYCITVFPIESFEMGDENCQTIDATEKEQLFLINPIDGDEIETPTPILIWFHSEPFNLLNQGEFFRLLLVKLDDNQSADAGITSNIPFFIKNNLTRHQVQYPIDANPLEKGGRYAWQIQKMANGQIVSTTETWSFYVADKKIPTDFRYVYVRDKLDGSVYNVVNDRIFFKYDERYNSSEMTCKIISDKREVILPETKDEEAGKESLMQVGNNKYELDLKPYKLKKGYFILEVYNEKKDKFQLKFYVNN